MTHQKETDHIIIVGGGMNGLTLSLLLAEEGFEVSCIDSLPTKFDTADNRTTAISYGSSRILKAAGIWDKIKPYACPIKEIKILDGKSPALLTFDIHETSTSAHKYDAFGWIVENQFLYKILYDACKKIKNLHHLTGQKVTNILYNENDATVTLDNDTTLKGNLIVGADGRQSFTRQAANIKSKKWRYNQKAFVFTVAHQRPHNNIAIEHFKQHGPFAILPMLDDKKNTHRSAVVWTVDKNFPDKFCHHPESLIAAMNERFPEDYGEVTHTTKPQIYPLNFNHAYTYIADKTVLIGDAAHGIHPIAGQGLNIGLQDVKALHSVLKKLKLSGKDIGDKNNLREYEILRRPDNTAMAAATDTLNRLFSNNLTGVKLFRQKGLKIIQKFPQSKKFFVSRAMGVKEK